MIKAYWIILFVFLLYISKVYSQVSIWESKIDSIFQDSIELAPGHMVAVIKNGNYIFSKAYGYANLEHKIKIDEKTCFNIASLSKQFTGAAIALLIQEGKLSLEDYVSDYLKDFKFEKDSIQIKHLVYMTSGINDYYYNDRRNLADWSSLLFFNIDTAILASYDSEVLMYKPGSQWSYSNINYMLLTKIVESISQKSFSEFLKEKIFIPLEMHSTLVNDDIFEIIPNRALGYNYRDKENTEWLLNSGYINHPGTGFLQIHRNSPHYGGSGIYTSISDFKKWINNFDTKTFGGAAFYNLMHKTLSFDHDKDNDAFGLVHGQYDDQALIWYEGGDWGFSSFMLRFPEKNLSFICFSNLGTGNAREVVWKIYDIMKEHQLLED